MDWLRMVMVMVCTARRALFLACLWATLAPAPSSAQTYIEVTPGGAAVTASTNDGNVPANTVDNDLGTRWSGQGDGQWIQYDLGSSQVIAYLRIASYSGNTRRARFDIQVSNDAASWDTVWVGQSSGTTTALEQYEIADVMARHVRLLGHGNSTNAWNSFTEVDIYASDGTPEPPTPAPSATATPPPTATPTATPPPTATPTPTPIPPGGPRSEHVNLGDDGRLVYHPYPNGDTIPDFSGAGYMGGGVRLPDVPVVTTVSPVDGDDGASIQAAIDEVSARTPDASGFRGTVLLTAGTYEIAGGISLRASGVVLRGEGDGAGGTLLKAVGTTRRTLITVAGVGNRAELSATQRPIVQTYVPVGAASVLVSDASGYAPGDDILVVRTPNQEWIDLTGTDACSTVGTAYDTSDVNNVTCISESHWTPGSRVMKYERKVVAVDGNRITVDSPIVEAIQAEFGGGHVVKYTFTGRIQQVGVESLRSESDWAHDTDEEHAVRMISISNVENGWVRSVTSVYYEQGTVMVGGGGKYITVQDSQSLDHKSVITGGRRYPFSLDDASHVLVMRCRARTGRHDYVTGSNTPGPNVFLDSLAEFSYSELGPHHRWATGSLFDRIVHQSYNGSQIIGAYNRGNSGSGHGWSGAYQLFWNCIGDTHRVASPPAARNWSIGCQVKRTQGDGEFESLQNPVTPGSLYLQQLKDRLGLQALINIGYSGVLPPPPPPTPTPTPTTTPTPTATPALIFETEHLAYTTSGPSAGVAGDNLASNKLWQSFGAKGPGDWIEYTLAGVPRGVYDLRFKYKTNPNRGIHNVAVDGVVIGGTIDQYKTGAGTFPEPTMGTVRFETDGDHVIRLTCVGKRPAAGAYTISSDRFVLVPDKKAPILSGPGDIELEATGPTGALATFEVTATDDKDGAVPVTLSHASGSLFPLGTTTVTATAEDFNGNKATVTFDVSVVDTRPPTIDVPEDIRMEATGPDGAVVAFTVSAYDAVSGSVDVHVDFPSGGTFPLGRTVVTATAADAADNDATATFFVDVVDTTPPVLTLPGALVFEATSASGAVATYSASAVDIVSGNVPVALTPPSGTLLPIGSTTVKAVAVDAAGNAARGEFEVIVHDTTAPVIERLVASPNVLWPPNHKMRPVDVAVRVSDAVDSAPVTRIVSITSNEPETGAFEGDIGPDTAITGPLSAQVRAERVGEGLGRVYTITVESRDRFGNASAATVTVTVPHSRGR